eukprot:3419954-Rhodomonas_salina.1
MRVSRSTDWGVLYACAGTSELEAGTERVVLTRVCCTDSGVLYAWAGTSELDAGTKRARGL